jgi:tetratricopeptide (TPR) repeat protein
VNKRLEFLEKVTAGGAADSFAWYGLAMEYRKLGRVEDAVQAFERLRDLDPSYLAMYLMAGQLLLEADRESDARVWLEQGIQLARAKGDAKALGELGDVLAQLEG